MPELRAHRLSKHFSGVRVVNRRQVHPASRRGGRLSRSERLGQDHHRPNAGRAARAIVGTRRIRRARHPQRSGRRSGASLGYIPEEPYLYPFLSGREYLQLVGRLRELPETLLASKIDGFLSLFGLSIAADQASASYSKGMRQKIVISAALMHDPAVVMFDEPETGLDVSTTMMLRHLVRLLASRGKAILYSSHILEVVERVCDKVIVLHKGDVVADDSIERLRTLMSSSSLEGVFSQLVIRDDPEKMAADLADVSAMSA